MKKKREHRHDSDANVHSWTKNGGKEVGGGQ